MADYTETCCPQCGQRLRIPERIGGMLMACPTCGKRIYSEFRLNHSTRGGCRRVLKTVFEMPEPLLSRLKRFFLSR